MKIDVPSLGDFRIHVTLLNGKRVLARQVLANDTKQWRIHATGNWTITSIRYHVRTDIGHGDWTWRLPTPAKVTSGKWVKVNFDPRGLIEEIYT